MEWEVQKVIIEIDISGGILDFRIVGIPDGAKEREQRKNKIGNKNSGFDFSFKEK